jgi:hypothetical protein
LRELCTYITRRTMEQALISLLVITLKIEVGSTQVPESGVRIGFTRTLTHCNTSFLKQYSQSVLSPDLQYIRVNPAMNTDCKVIKE